MPWLDAGLIVIGHPGSERISIKITDRDEECWLASTLDVKVGPWSGHISASFRQGELRRFADEVEKLHGDLVGRAQLSPMEPCLELTLTGDGKGHISVKGAARDLSRGETYLAFVLGLDQTDLPGIVGALRAADPE